MLLKTYFKAAPELAGEKLFLSLLVTILYPFSF